MTDTNTRSYIDGTHLFLGVEAILTQEERQQFLDKVFASNPQFRGAHVADVLDMFDNYDALLEVTEPLHEAHAAEIDAYGIPRLFTLCMYLAVYLDNSDYPQLWDRTKELVARWETKRCGHVWYEYPQEGEVVETDERGFVHRRCTLDKDHPFPVDHHDRRAPNF